MVQEGVSLSFLLAFNPFLTLFGKLSIKNDLKCCRDPEDSQSRFFLGLSKYQDFSLLFFVKSFGGYYLDKYYKYLVHPSIIVK